MFDFALGSKRRKGTASQTVKPPVEIEKPVVEYTQEVIKEEPEDVDVKDEGNNYPNYFICVFFYMMNLFSEIENSLKIIYEGDAYKCPIDGCGKNFRKENLAQMHVKHYHPEYTKYLDSTPNVADLAYARTVGEKLDSSPGIINLIINYLL